MVVSIDYREPPEGTRHDQNSAGEADRRVGQLLSANLPEHTKLVLVGSSMDSYVSTVASARLQGDGLLILAPAFYLNGYGNQEPVPRAQTSMIVHGWGTTLYQFKIASGLPEPTVENFTCWTVITA